MENKVLYKEEKQTKQLKELRHIMNHIFFAIIRVDLLKDRASVLHSVDFPQRVGQEFVWTEYLDSYRHFAVTEGIESFSPYRLWRIYQSGQRSFSKDLSYMTNGSREWLTMDAFIEIENARPYATVTVRKSTREHLQKSIIEQYVYNKCDYFIYLDAGNNSYETFGSAENDAPLLPAKSEDYSAEIVKYANDYVVDEDRERIICDTGLETVLEQLGKAKRYSLTCGVMDPVRGYTRKQLEYQYYDQSTQMVLLSCTDITDLYVESKKKENELLAALERARTDSLTGLLNHEGVVEEINLSLENEENRKCALMFIDMDNFKSVNDSLGHIAGDELLCKTADILKAGAGEGNLAGRVGGDEFVVFLRDIPSTEEAEKCAKRLCRKIHHLSLDLHFPVSCSIGLAVSPEDGADYTSLTENADNRVYAAKAKGKNQVAVNRGDNQSTVN